MVGGHARTVQHQYSSIATRCVGASSLAANGSQDGFLRSSGRPNQEAAAPEIGEEREMCQRIQPLQMVEPCWSTQGQCRHESVAFT